MSLERIEMTPISMIVGEVIRERRTGTLTVIRQAARKTLFWSQGELVLITSSNLDDSLASFAVARGVIDSQSAAGLLPPDPVDTVPVFRQAAGIDPATRQTLLRDWILSLWSPLLSLDEGTCLFVHDTAIEPEKRIFLQSTPALVLAGIRSISNGLVLRRSLGDLKREILQAREPAIPIEALPLSESESRIASSLTEPQTIENFLKQFATDSVTAAKAVIAMLTLGIFQVSEGRPQPERRDSSEDLERDLALLASIGSQDKRSLRTVGMARQLASIDYYDLIEAPRASTRNEIVTRVEQAKRKYDPASFPPAVRESAEAIVRRIEQGGAILTDASKRQEYDRLMSSKSRRPDDNIDQKINQRSIAEQNFVRAQDLAANSDYYGAIVLLKQAVQYAPNLVEAWYLLGSCQERNPHWRRDASESFMKVLALNASHVPALTSLGDLYRTEGLASRAQSYYEDALQIEPENAQLKKRIKELKK
ncbi:MAG TPA: hypothetical protein VNM92_19010 [Thermoanaerobaculia bacterium]|nr:hypothetical protein [Thermoanaerobaculia bacterium]